MNIIVVSVFQSSSEHQDRTIDKCAYVHVYIKILHLHFDKEVL